MSNPQQMKVERIVNVLCEPHSDVRWSVCEEGSTPGLLRVSRIDASLVAHTADVFGSLMNKDTEEAVEAECRRAIREGMALIAEDEALSLATYKAYFLPAKAADGDGGGA